MRLGFLFIVTSSSCPLLWILFLPSLYSLSPCYLPRYSICVCAQGSFTSLWTQVLMGGKQHFTISLLIRPLTVKGCLNSEGPAQERTGRSVMSALRVPWPFTFFRLIPSLPSTPSLLVSLPFQLSFFGLIFLCLCFVKCWWITTEPWVCLWIYNSWLGIGAGLSSIIGGAIVCVVRGVEVWGCCKGFGAGV